LATVHPFKEGSKAMRPIVDDLTPPVDLDRDHWRGDERAAAFRAIQRLEQQLGGLRFVFRHLPLTRIHPHALAAAHLAEAAAFQGRFWPVHELLFHHQKALEDPDLLRDADSAIASGARGTPTLFINGRLHVAGYDEPTLGPAVDAAIKEG
jgi:protein-disulfide isomerase